MSYLAFSTKTVPLLVPDLELVPHFLTEKKTAASNKKLVLA